MRNYPYKYILSILFLILEIFPISTLSESRNFTRLNQINVCPAPLIASPIYNYTGQTCFGGCCIPCPYINNFYPEGHIDMIYTVLSVLRVISFVCIAIIVLSYLVLPNKREHPAMIVLIFNICLLAFIGINFFYIGNHKSIQCADDFTQSTMKNNVLCGVQAITNNISFDFGAVCMVSKNISKELFWAPLAMFVIPAFLIHIVTFIYVAKAQWMLARDFEDSSLGTIVTNSTGTLDHVTSQDVLNVIKIQWRSLLLAMVLLITYIIFMVTLTATSQLSPLLSSTTDVDSWIIDWLNCLKNHLSTNDGQNQCAYIPNGHIPNIVFLTIAELLTASVGISIFLVFGTSVGLLMEWKNWFTKIFGRVEKHSSNIFL
ncbi:10114_t:CDS:2 [Cetraspora pellucida]|uniref:10114_t:CDS:1 n=1 Tax=Cetraspora pellucida TaxID=1433469 RepID=A0A9N9AKA5_9GLOM|nr:10114_t:CDS:2 [Cetraspora pellucida]